MSPSIRDIAQEAGVSPATVSRVLSGKSSVSEATRQRVLSAARRLHYRPAEHSRPVPGKPTRSIALLVPWLSHPFYGELAEGVESAARKLGYDVLVVSVAGDAVRQRSTVEALVAKGVDGFLFTTLDPVDEQVQSLIRDEYPIAFLTREILELECHCVVNDDFRGGLMATQHLIELDHQRIAGIVMTSPFAGSPERGRGYKTAMLEAGLDRFIQVVEIEGAEIEDGYQAGLSLLSAGEVTAVVAHNDIVAIGVLQACRELGKRVPEDVSVVGYDCTILAKVTTPPLTSVAQPTRDIGAVGMELLHQLVSSSVRAPRKVVLQPTLWVGQTTAPPRSGRVEAEPVGPRR